MKIVNLWLLLLKVSCLYALAPWNMETGFNHITKHMHKLATERNLLDSETKWIEQPLDHFDSKETRTWNMKYLQNLKFYTTGGPIYLYIGGEGPIGDAFGGSSYYSLIEETHGAWFHSEHRYYGESIPLDLYEVDNMKYLSSEQALADLYHLIKTIKSSPTFEQSKVVVIGGSYPGNLAAWMRAKYPDVVDAAWSSSAPMLAKKDFFEYIEQVSEDYKKYGTDGCYEKINKIFSRYDQLSQSPEGIEQLKKENNICEETDLTNPLNKALFFNSRMFYFMGHSQYGTPADIISDCNKINDGVFAFSEKPVSNNVEKNNIQTEPCANYDFSLEKDKYRDANWSWIYQTCTEFGYFQTTDSDNQPFTKNVMLNLFTETCSLLYGSEFDEERVNKGVAYTNNNYGGLTPNVNKVVFVHSSMDPWSRLGITNDLSDDAPARIIHDSSHCSDLTQSTPYNKEEHAKVLAFVFEKLKQWLGL